MERHDWETPDYPLGQACLLPADMPRELLGEAIYRMTYEHVGGKWEANETREYWYECADRLKSILSKVRPA